MPAERVAFSEGNGLDSFDDSARELGETLGDSGAEITGPLTGLFHDDPRKCGKPAYLYLGIAA